MSSLSLYLTTHTHTKAEVDTCAERLRVHVPTALLQCDRVESSGKGGTQDDRHPFTVAGGYRSSSFPVGGPVVRRQHVVFLSG